MGFDGWCYGEHHSRPLIGKVRKRMKVTVVGIYVWRGKAYLPVQGQFESGIYVDLEPVYVAELTLDGLMAAVQKVVAAGIPRLPEPTEEEWRKRKSPILTATKARNWKELARAGASYDIVWRETQIRVNMSRLDKQGRWEFDPTKVRIFPPDTPLEEIIAVILADIRTRPEVWEAAPAK